MQSLLTNYLIIESSLVKVKSLECSPCIRARWALIFQYCNFGLVRNAFWEKWSKHPSHQRARCFHSAVPMLHVHAFKCADDTSNSRFMIGPYLSFMTFVTARNVISGPTQTERSWKEFPFIRWLLALYLFGYACFRDLLSCFAWSELRAQGDYQL